MMRIAVLGGGMMGRALVKGFLRSGHDAGYITVADINPEARAEATRIGLRATESCEEAALNADMLLIALKPQVLQDVLSQIKPLTAERLVVSIAAGKSLAWLRERMDASARLIRLMPNTPASIGAGMTAVCPDKSATEDDIQTILKLLGGTGRAELMPEKLINAVIAVSGSSPAYVFMMIEAMADGAVREGMPREAAYRFAAQAVFGSARMVLESGMHPAALKDGVCSPGGTTIEAVAALEKSGFRAALLDAMRACAEKAEHL